MPYVPKFTHLIKMLFGVRDRAAAEGLFLGGSIEFESGDLNAARMMFTYGTRLDPTLGGNWYNLAVVTEKQSGASGAAVRAWEAYLAAAPRDPRQPAATQEKVRAHVAAMKQKLQAAPSQPPRSG